MTERDVGRDGTSVCRKKSSQMSQVWLTEIRRCISAPLSFPIYLRVPRRSRLGGKREQIPPPAPRHLTLAPLRQRRWLPHVARSAPPLPRDRDERRVADVAREEGALGRRRRLLRAEAAARRCDRTLARRRERFFDRARGDGDARGAELADELVGLAPLLLRQSPPQRRHRRHADAADERARGLGAGRGTGAASSSSSSSSEGAPARSIVAVATPVAASRVNRTVHSSEGPPFTGLPPGHAVASDATVATDATDTSGGGGGGGGGAAPAAARRARRRGRRGRRRARRRR